MVLALVGILFGVMIIAGNDGQIDNMMFVAYAVLFLVIASVVVFTVLNLVSHKEALIGALKGVGSFLVLALICYFVFAEGVETELRDGEMLSASDSKLVGAGLYMFYALAIIASGTMLYTGVKKMIK
ncbi:MAG: hypothetical protein P8L65_06365 [Flavobacteriaceae bacterium]|nr:hypothetical protein [Flavobacteriaceae bacterium]MDC0957901.1 hypothetical protein [Flavobacteriaceae bacterium]MDC3269117.1 hypothetical protein [Flavobacteriaceae bacterium]MDG2350289.1 hypothetical protein [Flavobacteriaceae bacterium]